MQSPKLTFCLQPRVLLVLTLLIWSFFTVLAFTHANGFNPDTTYYLTSAALFNQHGLAAAFSGFSRPFYPILIGSIHSLTGISYFASAHLINLVAQWFIILGLFYLARCLKLKPQYYIWLAILILISPVLTEVRAFIIRDFCFLAAWIFGFAMLLQYAESNQKKCLFLYHLLMLVSILFRSDGCVLWLLAPLGLLFYPQGRRKLIWCYTIIFAIVVCALIFIFYIKHNYMPKNVGYYLSTYINQSTTKNLYHTLFSSLLLAHTQEALQYVAVDKIFIYGLPVYFILHIFGSFNYVLSLFLLLGIASFHEKTHCKLLYWTVIVYTVMLAVFFSQNLFFSSRYQAGMSLLLFMPSVYGMGLLWDEGAKRFWLRLCLILVIVVTGLYNNWPKADSRAYQTPAIAWLKQQTGVICSNQRTILFATTPPGSDFQKQVMVVKLDPRLPQTWSLPPEFLSSLNGVQCHWLVLTLHQATPEKVASLKQQLSQQLQAPIRYHIENDSRVLWVFELKPHQP